MIDPRNEVGANGEIALENLPYPAVHYPRKYGTFVSFANDPQAESVLCACAEPAVANWLLMGPKLLSSITLLASVKFLSPDAFALVEPTVAWTDRTTFFPPSTAKQIVAGSDYANTLRFKPGVCHKCNSALPSLLYCDKDFSGSFASRFGWYINQTYLALGIVPQELGRAPARFAYFHCPSSSSFQPELRHLVDEQRELQLRFGVLQDKVNKRSRYGVPLPTAKHPEIWQLKSAINQAAGRLNRAIENLVRAEFRHKRIGDAYVHETMLYHVIERLFPEREILRHAYPRWLEGLELDIYLPGERLGIEYQGEQHFRPIQAWGGRQALELLQERDKRKANLCKVNGITLVYFDHASTLTEEFVRSVLRNAGNAVR